MNAKTIFYNTLVISIFVQIITALIEISSLFIKVPSPYVIIRQLLIMELLVQMIEGLFYIWLAYNIATVTNITPKRYIDWAITTPTMLITLIIYFIYLKHKETNDTESLELFPLIRENSTNISYVLILNWIMLLFGYLGEMKVLPTFIGVGLGFIPFFIYFYIIYNNYVIQNNTAITIFWYFFIFWSLYGIAALLPYYVKNAFYNILDLFAKNFFGIFLSYIIISSNY
jgi:bacteriorhodopsin